MSNGLISNDWVQHSIWWHVYPLGALDADPTGRDRTCHRSLSELIPWLDHVVGLGANGIVLGPIFQSSTHGYDTLDYYRIDDRLGSDADFDALVGACRERGIRIMLDGVFNHVSREHELVRDPQRAVSEGWAIDAGHGHLHSFEGHEQLVTLNHANPAVAEMIASVMNHWLDRGVDAWRLDAAYAVPTSFWSQVLPRVRAAHPDVYVCGEVIHGDYVTFVRESGVDSVTQYELWKATWSSIRDANMHELAWSLKRNNQFLDAFVPWTFIGNHDVTRIATQLEGVPSELALVLLATLPGTPAIYYGDELGWTGVKEERFGGDDAIRPPLPAHLPSDPPPIYRRYQELFSLRRRHPEVQTGQVETTHVDQGTLVYRVGGSTPLVVALNAALHAVTAPLVAGDTLASSGARREADYVQLDAGGWLIAAG